MKRTFLSSLPSILPSYIVFCGNRTYGERLISSNPRSWWIDERNQRSFLDNLSKKLRIRSWKDWYSINGRDILFNGGGTLLQHYNNSYPKLITSIYSDHPWNLREFSKIPRSYWRKRSNQLEFLESLKKPLRIDHWTDWYRVSKRDIMDDDGDALLQQYGGSHRQLIMSVYTDYPWNILHFKTVPRSYWKNTLNQLEFMNRLHAPLHINKWTDWYHISGLSIIEHGGGTLLQQYGNSVPKLLMSLYPDRPWQPFKFQTRIVWDHNLARSFFDQIARQQHIHLSIAWRTISETQIKDYKGGKSLLASTKSLTEALRYVIDHISLHCYVLMMYRLAYPADNWNFLVSKKMSRPHHLIVEMLSSYIPRHLMLINYRHPQLVNN